jgi:hypothetical protein
MLPIVLSLLTTLQLLSSVVLPHAPTNLFHRSNRLHKLDLHQFPQLSRQLQARLTIQLGRKQSIRKLLPGGRIHLLSGKATSSSSLTSKRCSTISVVKFSLRCPSSIQQLRA